MKSGYLENKPCVNGVPQKIICHNTEIDFPVVTAAPHYHSYIEILYCTEGVFTVYLTDSEFEFSEGDMVLISSGEVHKVFHNGNSLGKYLVIRLDPEILYGSTQSLFEMKHLLAFMVENTTSQKLFRKNELENSDVPHLIKNIFNEYNTKDYGYELAMNSDICRMFLWIVRYWKSNGTSDNMVFGTEELAERLYPAIEYMRTNFGEDISAESMAVLCNMSYSYFSRSFKTVFSKGFNDYLNQLRIYEAEKLLLTTDMNITEIGLQTGYTTTSYFIQQFKKIKSISPKQYKMQLKTPASQGV